MRHGMAHRKLGRTSSHRAAMFRNQLASMISNERIITTLPKAKELRPIVEKMVTLAKNDSVHTRRIAAESITDGGLVQKLFTDISPRFSARPGGYTRIIKLGPRRGDGAEMAILEFVDFQLAGAKESAPAKKAAAKKAAAKKEAAPAAEEPETEESAEEEKPARKPAAKKAAPKKPAAKKPAAEKAKKPAAKKPAAKAKPKAK